MIKSYHSLKMNIVLYIPKIDDYLEIWTDGEVNIL